MTKSRSDSRGPTIDTDQLVKNVGGNRFELVLIAAQRAREIARQHKRSESTTHSYSAVDALLEIQEGKIGKEYLNKI